MTAACACELGRQPGSQRSVRGGQATVCPWDSAPREDRPARHAPTRPQPPQASPAANQTRPTASAHPRCQAQSPGTQGVVPTPAARPRRMSAPCTQARAEHVRPRVHAGLVPETGVSAYVSRARATPAIRHRSVHMTWDREA